MEVGTRVESVKMVFFLGAASVGQVAVGQFVETHSEGVNVNLLVIGSISVLAYLCWKISGAM